MNAQDYIASGLLEAYVFGVASEAEAAEVALAISKYPEVAAEVAAIEETMYMIGKESAITPPAHLKNEIWDKINSTSATKVLPVMDGHPSMDATPTPQVDELRSIPLDSQAGKWRWLQAAVWVGLIGSLLGNFMQYNGHKGLEETYVVLEQKVNNLSADQQKASTILARYQKEADMMADPDMKPIVMQTMQKDHPMAATIYWSKSKSAAYVSVQKLPMPPKGKQYQLWAIAGGKPVDLGVLHNEMIGTSGMEKVEKAVADGQAFAISLENEGGSPTPSMDQIFVMGKVI